MYFYTTELPHFYSAVLLNFCPSILLYSSIANTIILLCCYAIILYIAMLLYYYTMVLLYHYITLLYFYVLVRTSIILYFCTSVLLYFCTVLLHFYTSVLLYAMRIIELCPLLSKIMWPRLGLTSLTIADFHRKWCLIRQKMSHWEKTNSLEILGENGAFLEKHWILRPKSGPPWRRTPLRVPLRLVWQ